MVDVIMQAVGSGIEAVESGIGGCVLGTAATAAAVCVGFRLAGYKLALTCRTVSPIRRNGRKEALDAEASPEEKEAIEEYKTAYNQWYTADKLNGAEDYYARAQKLRAEVERKRRERQAFQEQRVAELDAIREERKAEKAAVEQNTPAADTPKNSMEDKPHGKKDDAGGGGGH